MNRSVLKCMALVGGACFLPFLGMLPAWSIENILLPGKVDEAIQWGQSQIDFGYTSVFDKNQYEGPMGSMVLVYTPYMSVAHIAAKAHSAKQTSTKNALNKRLKQEIRYLKYTPPESFQVKMVILLYGDTETFLTQIQPTLEGFGQGRTQGIKPTKTVVDTKASLLETRHGKPVYTGSIALYLPYQKIMRLETLKLTLAPKPFLPDGTPVDLSSSGLTPELHVAFDVATLR
ncbi:MAG: hypothetical protein ACKO37_04725 [Vampirovibrionales bacterium]